jgi:hypothetical protein
MVSNSFSPMMPAPPTSTMTARSRRSPAVERGQDLVGTGDPDAGGLDVAGLLVHWCSSLPRRSDDRTTHLPSADSRSRVSGRDT